MRQSGHALRQVLLFLKTPLLRANQQLPPTQYRPKIEPAKLHPQEKPSLLHNPATAEIVLDRDHHKISSQPQILHRTSTALGFRV